MRKLKYTLGFLVAVLFVQNAQAQRNFGFYSLDHLPQSHYYNPTFNSNNRLYLSVALGTHSFGVSHSGFTLDDLLTPRPQDDSLNLDIENAISKMDDLNFLDFHFHNELFGMGLQFKKRYISFSAIHRTDLQFAYPRDLFKLMFEGNGGSLLGQRASMDGLGLNLNSYIEFAMGYNQSIGKRFKVGSRVKFLSGIANVDTKRSQLGLTTDEDTYALTLDGALDLRTSGVFDENLEFADPSTLLSSAASFKNFGMAVDAGTVFKPIEKLTISTSVLDAGFISWKNNTYSIKQDEFEITFDGVDMRALTQDSNYFEKLQDSIESVFDLESTTTNYRSALPTRTIAGVKYDFTKNFGLGVTHFSDWSVGKYRPTFMTTASFKLGNWLFINGNYIITNRSFNNFGVSACIKALGVQAYVTTDNIMTVVNPNKTKNAHVAVGVAFQFGKMKDDDKKKKKDKVEEMKKSDKSE